VTRIALIGLALALAAVAVGCGGNGDDAASPLDTVTAPEPPPAATNGDDDADDTPPGQVGEGEVFEVEEAGSVTLRRDGGRLELVSVDPASGWDYEVTDQDDDEVEIDFLRDARKVYEFKAELDDGRIEIEIDRED
jgi:hypothetical protein